MRHRISAGALVVDDGRILLVREEFSRAGPFWVAPGGGVEADEELAAAAEREAREETGLAVRAGRLVYVEDGFDGTTRTAKFWFLAALLDAPAEPAGDLTAQWFARDALPDEVYPLELHDRFWRDLEDGFPQGVVMLPLRRWRP
ncbi:MAG: NUDIX domain-containing protein [Bauldia sp.]